MPDLTAIEPLIQAGQTITHLLDHAMIPDISAFERVTLRWAAQLMRRLADRQIGVEAALEDMDHVFIAISETANKYVGQKSHPIHAVLIDMTNGWSALEMMTPRRTPPIVKGNRLTL